LGKIVKKTASNYVNMLNNLLRAEPEDGGFDRGGKGVVLALSTSSGAGKNKVLLG
jgi:hypothetical protein